MSESTADTGLAPGLGAASDEAGALLAIARGAAASVLGLDPAVVARGRAR